MELKQIQVFDDDVEWADYKYDCERICLALLRHGYICTIEQAYKLWTKYSESMAAGWMALPEVSKYECENENEVDATILNNVSSYFSS